MRALAFLLLTGLAAAPVSAQKLKSVQTSKSADYPSYKTFSFLPIKTMESSGVVEDNPRIAPVVRDAIAPQLTAKGLKQVPSGGDLEINVYLARYSSPHLEALTFIGPPDATYAVGGPISTTARYNEEGTMVVNVIDVKAKKSAFFAMATSTLKRDKPAYDKIKSAAEKMFKHYPSK
ncbi:MAG: DUF4136 domain-containing protein [Acidobacteria bacterium]|nr:DUF4136 domain-containing protein [Acidobacteriota bacterium]